MKILVINRGSSSLKIHLYDFEQFPEKLVKPTWEKKIQWENIRRESSSENELHSILLNQDYDCIGHRIVHGGNIYQESVFIDKKAIETIRSLADLAPLHNLADLEAIELLQKQFPDKPQFAVFDTAFHHTLPKSASIYPGPYKWVEKGIKRYGFHGINFQYCTKRSEEILGTLPERMVICHLGSGASLCAVKEGKSIDTTMGFTPLEGLMMDTRSGTVDPGILLYLLKEKRGEELSRELYEQSGILGLSGISSDMRDILAKASQNNSRAQLTIDVYIHRLISSIGSMIASLGGIDALIFTGGIGENSPWIWEKVCERLAFLNLHLEIDAKASEDAVISLPNSGVKVLVIQAQEAFEIAKECWRKIHSSPI